MKTRTLFPAILIVMLVGCNTASDDMNDGEVLIEPFINSLPTGISISSTREKADNGNAVAQRLLGLINIRDNDFLGAKIWLLKAADNGDETANYILGIMYFYGVEVNKDYVAAKEYFAQSAHLNNTQAQAHLGQIFANGLGGIERDNQKAFIWSSIAAIDGDDSSKELLDELLLTFTGATFDLLREEALSKIREINKNLEHLKGEKNKISEDAIAKPTNVGAANNYVSNPTPAHPSLPAVPTVHEDTNNDPCSGKGYAATYNAMSGKCECRFGQAMINDVCQKPPYCGSNGSYDEKLEKCVCNYGYREVGGECVYGKECAAANSTYNALTDRCECISGYYVSNNICKKIPNCVDGSSFNFDEEICVCDYGYYLKNGYCYELPNCPYNAHFDSNLEKCVCNALYVSIDGQCEFEALACGLGATYNRQTGKCVCNSGYYMKNGTCTREPYCGGGTFNEVTGTCNCSNGYYEKADGSCGVTPFCGDGQFDSTTKGCRCYEGATMKASGYCSKY